VLALLLAGCGGSNGTGESPHGDPFLAQSLTAGGGYTCGLTSGGVAYCWGRNVSGQLGDGTTTYRLTPVPVAGRLIFTSLSAGGSHTCGLATTGAAYCWGWNGFGQLGDGTTTSSLTPVSVAGGLTFANLTTTSTGGLFSAHSCGRTSTGVAYCWGRNALGQLGDGTTHSSLTPVPVAGGLTFVGLSAGGSHTCGWTLQVAAYCWGWNGDGQLGDGTTTISLMPLPVRY
jgi:alpha-tubulin suppressor-like RCC1 family protein